ncbi:MAG: GTP-dependent dephospho-CoA kinase family protein [Candidatus Bathyarchaeota archaeon]|nr:GTP-dependent dephospho-CoA kinase family protein [Candidatus Bathyarchaeota archaeon]
MTIYYVVTPETLSKFKEPFGTLIRGVPSETMKQLKELMEKENPPKVISVGDTVTRNLHRSQISPQVSITDNYNMRRKVKPQSYPAKILVQVKNPQGTITQEAVNAVKEAIQNKNQVHIAVEGEEDLLTLIAVFYAPENALVVYGQPKEGIVVVKVTPEKKAESKRIWESMKTLKETKAAETQPRS